MLERLYGSTSTGHQFVLCQIPPTLYLHHHCCLQHYCFLYKVKLDRQHLLSVNPPVCLSLTLPVPLSVYPVLSGKYVCRISFRAHTCTHARTHERTRAHTHAHLKQFLVVILPLFHNTFFP